MQIRGCPLTAAEATSTCKWGHYGPLILFKYFKSVSVASCVCVCVSCINQYVQWVGNIWLVVLDYHHYYFYYQQKRPTYANEPVALFHSRKKLLFKYFDFLLSAFLLSVSLSLSLSFFLSVSFLSFYFVRYLKCSSFYLSIYFFKFILAGNGRRTGAGARQ